MQKIDWNDIQYCLAVIREGSVSAAAKKLGVNHTTVSRRISALEKQLHANLFDRSTSGWLLTPVGESILPAARQMEEEFLSIQRAVQADSQELSGKLRVTAVDVCIQRMLMKPLRIFSQRYPEIDIELLASEETLDLSVHDADIAFRVTNEPPPNVVGKKVAEFAYQVYATPELLKRYREKDTSVGAITWLGDGQTLPDWMLKDYPDMRVRYRCNSLNVAIDLARSGQGFVQLPCALGDSESALTRVPGRHVQPGLGLWVLSHIDLRTTARIRIFRDFMLEAIAPDIPLIEGLRPEAWKLRVA